MIVFATSDKGGTGRSVTSSNIAYRLFQNGYSVAYLDFDFGSPTAGALFEISVAEHGVHDGRGMHSYLLGDVASAMRCDVRTASDRPALRRARSRTGRLVLLPGDDGGAEFTAVDDLVVRRAVALFASLQQEFRVVIIDLSAGRSLAMELALRATAAPQLTGVPVRWLIHHRWTRQHIVATSGLVHGRHGLLDEARHWTHEPSALLQNLRYVRTAVPAVTDAANGVSDSAQAAWLLEQNSMLNSLAAEKKLGASSVLGKTPVEPLLQWREQIILDTDVANRIANEATTAAFSDLATRLVAPATWDTY